MGDPEKKRAGYRKKYRENRSGFPGDDCILEKNIFEKEGIIGECDTDRRPYKILWKISWDP